MTQGSVLQGPVLIVGAGHAGFQLAASLRQHGFAERIALLNDESHLPYQRPPLSKAYLKGTGARNRLLDIPNASLPDVLYLRTLDESEALRHRIAMRKHVVVIGAGFIGL